MIKINEPEETPMLLKKKKYAQAENFLKGIIRSLATIHSLEENASTKAKLEKEVNKLNDGWDDLDFMDFEPISTLSEHLITTSK